MFKFLNCCSTSRLCNDLPGICILMQIVFVIALTGALGFLFVTQELLS